MYFKTHSGLPTTININGTTLGPNATRKIKLDPLSLQNLEPPQQISPKSKLHHKSLQITIYCSPNNQPTYHSVKRKKKKKKEKKAGTTRVEDNKQTFILKSNDRLTTLFFCKDTRPLLRALVANSLK